MLRKVDQLDYVGRFEKLKHKATDFRRLALVFARNGMGKSTICAVLRGAAQNDSMPLAERVHLGKTGSAEAKLEFSDIGPISFLSGNWTKASPPMLVFDQEFVRRNVHQAEEVTRGNKRGLFQVIIGSTGVTLAREIESLDEESRRLAGEINRLEKEIRAAAPSISDVPAFIKADTPDQFDSKLEAAKRENNLAVRSREIGSRPLLSMIHVSESWDNIPTILSHVPCGSLDESREAIERHIEKHDLGEKGPRWLEFGFDHSSCGDCPYCDQDLTPSQVYHALQDLFGEEYRTLSQTVDDLQGELEPHLSTSRSGLSELLDRNQAICSYWKEVAEVSALPSLSAEQRALMVETIDQIHGKLVAKAKNISKAIACPEEDAWLKSVKAFREYDQAVSAINKVIDSTKMQVASTGLDAAAAQTRLSKFEALRDRSEEPLKSLIADWEDYAARHKAAGAEKKAKQDALKTYMKKTADDYQDDVNQLLKRFATNFTLHDTKASFAGGGKPNTEYSIDIDGYVLPAGESKDDPQPSFRTALSAGDKSSLALALFLVQASRRTDIADLILVFDDPFNSQDLARQFQTTAHVRRLARAAKQIIVFSHDPRFLHSIVKDAGGIEVSEHQVSLEARWRGKIERWSAEDEIKSDYVRRSEKIREYALTGSHLGDSNPSQLVSDIRVFLEEYLDLRFPGRFSSADLLGAMCIAIADDPSDPLHEFHQELAELNEYSRKDHHRGTTPPDPSELQAHCQTVLDIVGSY